VSNPFRLEQGQSLVKAKMGHGPHCPMQFAFAQQVSNPFGLEQGVELGEGAVWLLAVGSHAKLCRATVCGGEKSAPVAKKLPQMN